MLHSGECLNLQGQSLYHGGHGGTQGSAMR
jgi:hypothetical protein